MLNHQSGHSHQWQAINAQGMNTMTSKFQRFSLETLYKERFSALLNQSMKRFLKALWLCPQSGEIIASFSNARFSR